MEEADKRRLRSECVKLLRAAGCEETVIKHCIAVAELALEIAAANKNRNKNKNIDEELIFTGALLHDMGRARSHGVEHGFLGGELAKASGLDDRLVKIIQRHVGAGITAEEAKQLGLPPISLMPETIEEKIVAYADCLIEGTRRTSVEHAISNLKKKLGARHPAVGRLKKLHEEVMGTSTAF